MVVKLELFLQTFATSRFPTATFCLFATSYQAEISYWSKWPITNGLLNYWLIPVWKGIANTIFSKQSINLIYFRSTRISA